MYYFYVCHILMCSLLFIGLIFFVIGLLLLNLDFSYFIEWELLSLNSSSVLMVFLFDWMSMIFMSIVLFISSMVIIYSSDYMRGDSNLLRFISLVLLFVLSMMFMVVSPNLISILLGWDGLGLVSYCLVIYFNNIKSYNAGMLTVLSNRLGDVALLISISWMLNFGSWSFMNYLKLMDSSMIVVVFLVLLASITKSAQIPFSSWLPAAMAAPTPVSALVHSSTLVTAGVYLMIRFSDGLLINPWLGQFLFFLSGVTMFMSGLGANYEFDLKKIIALSTLSQLGLMMMTLSLGFSYLAFFHLLTHAMFKSLLFLCAGAMIHNLMNSQDIRGMGGICLSMPITSLYFNGSSLALGGMPFLSGFYSKDLILEVVSGSYLSWCLFFFFFFSTGLTVCYSVRLIYFSMLSDFNVFSLHPLSSDGGLMQGSMFFLFLMSIMGGCFLSWFILSTPYFIYLPLGLKMLTLFVCLLGFILGYYISSMKLYFNMVGVSLLINFFSFMWFLPNLVSFSIFSPLYFGGKLYKGFDQGWIEFFFVGSLVALLSKSSDLLTIIYFRGWVHMLIVFVVMGTFCILLL